jgi:mxaJ protein
MTLKARLGPAVLSLGLAICLTSLASGPIRAQDWEVVVCADPSVPPFSERNETGFENRIAYILGEELGATVVFDWVPLDRTLTVQALRSGECDMVVGVPDGAAGMLTTLTYYRSPYVFVYRTDEPYDVTTFDDPILSELRIGVQPADGPHYHALLTRDLGDNITMEVRNAITAGIDDPLEPIITAVADGEIDVAVLWGPAAGYYAHRQSVPLTVTPVPPFEPPLVQMYLNMTVGVRIGDEALRDLIDIAIVNSWDDIQAVLAEYDIPTMPLTPPVLTIEVP